MIRKQIETILGYKPTRTYYKNIGGFKKKITAPTNYDSRIDKLELLLNKEVEGEREKWLNFYKEDIVSCFIPRCTWCNKTATKQTANGKYAQENNHRPVNWGYFCNKCYLEGTEIEEEAIYG